jgi:hypothetical protein
MNCMYQNCHEVRSCFWYCREHHVLVCVEGKGRLTLRSDTWSCPCGYAMPEPLARCVKCGQARPVPTDEREE